MAIVPLNNDSIIGKMTVPSEGAGEIREGQAPGFMSPIERERGLQKKGGFSGIRPITKRNMELFY